MNRALKTAMILTFFILFGCNDQKEEEYNLSIFYINDLHGSFENLDKVQEIIEQERRKRETLFFCSGDVFSGNITSDFYPKKGYPSLAYLNELNLDACALGNHDFNFGSDTLHALIKASKFDWICSNYQQKSGRKSKIL